ncbi:RNA polymerase II-associated protein RBA50 [Colletotrichum tanaceti]|uniref:RNA polymerase II-associated protein RBA50 n=1 Tax=Colletotrichum tanaceti TaxID=1306861 RepID=A0A4U6XWE6_9PEZI|nr:RNA polymerase II-associated protein RBA50 [Colletotrichum tanaceti]
MNTLMLVGDIVEKETPPVKPPVVFDDIDAAPTGFPAHKKRTRVSAFKQQRQGKPITGAQAAAATSSISASQPGENGGGNDSQKSFEAAERRRIDRENRQKLEDMSPDDIARERRELMESLDPSLIQRLLGKANIDEQHGPNPFDPPAAEDTKAKEAPAPAPEIKIEDTSAPPKPQAEPWPASKSAPKSVSFAEVEDSEPSPRPLANEDKPPSAPPEDLFPLNSQPDKTHFPQPPALPDLDPSHPDFLATLHEKFFPNLPADPSKLAWMAPIPTAHSPADRESPYYPGQPSLPISALRFDFKGGLIPPKLSRSIPVSKGLHHHGQAPEAAGYTIEELAIYARSAVPAQRCVAFQTLGRILYRLGKGEWGNGEEDSLARGIWSSIQEGRVLESLSEAAIVDGGHRGSRAYATEALWLFEKGGWREQWSGR